MNKGGRPPATLSALRSFLVPLAEEHFLTPAIPAVMAAIQGEAPLELIEVMLSAARLDSRRRCLLTTRNRMVRAFEKRATAHACVSKG